MKIWLILLFLQYFPFASAQENSSCLEQMTQSLHEQEQSQDKIYGQARPGNESVLLKGTNTQRAIILAHGYIGSPFEVSLLGQKLNAAGFTVYMPLLPGFGRSVKVANQVHWRAWTEAVWSSFKTLSQCFPEVSMAGFSLGGEIVTAVAVEHASDMDRLASLILFSPSLRIQNRFLVDILTPFFWMLSYQINVQRTNRWLRKIGNHELEGPANHPQFYNSALPLKAVKQLRKMGRSFKWSDFEKLKALPIELIYSGNDQTVNSSLACRKIHKYDETFQCTEIPKKDRISHQILLPDSNPDIEVILKAGMKAVLE